MEKRSHLRRLANLGVYGHHAATKAYLDITNDEYDIIAKAILQQKVASITKTVNEILDTRKKAKSKENYTRIKLM